MNSFWDVIYVLLSVLSLVLLSLLIYIAIEAVRTIKNMRLLSDRLEKMTNVAIWGTLLSGWFRRKKSS